MRLIPIVMACITGIAHAQQPEQSISEQIAQQEQALEVLHERYYQEHPRIAEAEQALIELEQQLPPEERAAIQQARAARLPEQIAEQVWLLEELRPRYSSNHPDVLMAERRLARLQEQLATLQE